MAKITNNSEKSLMGIAENEVEINKYPWTRNIKKEDSQYIESLKRGHRGRYFKFHGLRKLPDTFFTSKHPDDRKSVMEA